MNELLLIVVPLLVTALFGVALHHQVAATRDAHPDTTDYDALYRSALGGTR